MWPTFYIPGQAGGVGELCSFETCFITSGGDGVYDPYTLPLNQLGCLKVGDLIVCYYNFNRTTQLNAYENGLSISPGDWYYPLPITRTPTDFNWGAHGVAYHWYDDNSITSFVLTGRAFVTQCCFKMIVYRGVDRRMPLDYFSLSTNTELSTPITVPQNGSIAVAMVTNSAYHAGTFPYFTWRYPAPSAKLWEKQNVYNGPSWEARETSVVTRKAATNQLQNLFDTSSLIPSYSGWAVSRNRVTQAGLRAVPSGVGTGIGGLAYNLPESDTNDPGLNYLSRSVSLTAGQAYKWRWAGCLPSSYSSSTTAACVMYMQVIRPGGQQIFRKFYFSGAPDLVLMAVDGNETWTPDRFWNQYEDVDGIPVIDYMDMICEFTAVESGTYEFRVGTFHVGTGYGGPLGVNHGVGCLLWLGTTTLSAGEGFPVYIPTSGTPVSRAAYQNLALPFWWSGNDGGYRIDTFVINIAGVPDDQYPPCALELTNRTDWPVYWTSDDSRTEIGAALGGWSDIALAQGNHFQATQVLAPKWVDGSWTKTYFEVTVNTVVAADDVRLAVACISGQGWPGVMTQVMSLYSGVTYDPLDNNAYGWAETRTFGGGTTTHTVGRVGEIIGFVVDYENQYIKIYRNGELLNTCNFSGTTAFDVRKRFMRFYCKGGSKSVNFTGPFRFNPDQTTYRAYDWRHEPTWAHGEATVIGVSGATKKAAFAAAGTTPTAVFVGKRRWAAVGAAAGTTPTALFVGIATGTVSAVAAASGSTTAAAIGRDGAATTNNLLLEDGTSYLLLEDGSSRLVLE